MKFIVLGLALVLFGSVVKAEETTGEKAAVVGNKAKRALRKGVNRVQETLCAQGDTKCEAEKAKNRLKEGTDVVKDKVTEVKNKAD